MAARVWGEMLNLNISLGYYSVAPQKALNFERIELAEAFTTTEWLEGVEIVLSCERPAREPGARDGVGLEPMADVSANLLEPR